jgi:hypothetical protein
VAIPLLLWWTTVREFTTTVAGIDDLFPPNRAFYSRLESNYNGFSSSGHAPFS